ncbi:MAG: tetratricopeptide repeat protein [Myxococcota bacterium]
MNPQQATDWTPGLVVLGAGIVLALLYLFGSKKLAADAPRPETLDDLEARYQSLLAELRTHIANKHLVPAQEFAREKARLEAAAAKVLREKEGKKHDELKAQARAEKIAAAPPTFAQKNQGLMGALVGGAVVAFFALLGWQLSSTASERGDGMQATGMVPPGGGRGPMQQQPESDPRLEALAGRVQANPQDADAVSDLAVYLIRRQAFADARPLVDRAMLIDPFHPKARVGRAVMKAVDGDLPGSIVDLERLAARYPEAYDGRMFAGMLSLEDNDPRRALANLEAYVELAPADEQPPMLRMAIAQLKQELAAPQPKTP